MGIDNRKTYIIGNWKMNFTPGEASIFLHKLQNKIKASRSIQVVVAPSTISLQTLSLQINRRLMKLAAQNFYWRDFGSYTGEVAIAQLRGFVDYAIIGHSERRYIFNENDKDIREKVAAAIRNQITPILCIGETAEERKNGETDMTISDQLMGGLSQVSKEDIDKVIVAYEPVWAISSTKNAKIAKPDEIETVIGRIRQHIAQIYGKKISESIYVVYGGSVDNSNAASYLNIPGIDGFLMGKSSLIADVFDDIIEIAKEIKK